MTRIKSFSVGNGDMFYINHESDAFTIIDCCLSGGFGKTKILAEICELIKQNSIFRFISTHPDQDHIEGLKELNDKKKILNFYIVDNNVVKNENTDDFRFYCRLRESQNKFCLYKGCKRKWLNEMNSVYGSSGINILWPVLDNLFFQKALFLANKGESLNNISPIIQYNGPDGFIAVWMGDLEKDFMENIIDDVDLPKKVNILFAPHHGRRSGKIPEKWLKTMNPDIIVIGEAPSEDLNYYSNYNTISQNSAKDITFECGFNCIDIYVGNENYKSNHLKNLNDLKCFDVKDGYYIGTLYYGL